MIKDIIENFTEQLKNDQNQMKIKTAIDPWLINVKLFCYVVIFLLTLIASSTCLITFKLYGLQTFEFTQSVV